MPALVGNDVGHAVVGGGSVGVALAQHLAPDGQALAVVLQRLGVLAERIGDRGGVVVEARGCLLKLVCVSLPCSCLPRLRGRQRGLQQPRTQLVFDQRVELRVTASAGLDGGVNTLLVRGEKGLEAGIEASLRRRVSECSEDHTP